jgi:hypothetical protein
MACLIFKQMRRFKEANSMMISPPSLVWVPLLWEVEHPAPTLKFRRAKLSLLFAHF